MNFQKLIVIEKYQTYLDIAFKNAAKKAEKLRANLRTKKRATKIKALELERIHTATESLYNCFETILKSYPRIEELPEFYLELVKCTLDVDKIKKSLGAVNWAKKKARELGKTYDRQLKKTKHIQQLAKVRQEFYGRVSSVVKQISKDLLNLENSRKTMKRYPALKTSMYTVVLAGAPNVGKSSLLAELTGTKPKIAHYPFTTKDLNLGYDKKAGIQYIDTPGLLDRPLAKRNKIEQQAVIALNKLAKLIVFILDPSETCGYNIKEQENILKEIKKKFKLPVIVAANKIDLECKDYKADFEISIKEKKGIEELKEKIISYLKK